MHNIQAPLYRLVTVALWLALSTIASVVFCWADAPSEYAGAESAIADRNPETNASFMNLATFWLSARVALLKDARYRQVLHQSCHTRLSATIGASGCMATQHD